MKAFFIALLTLLPLLSWAGPTSCGGDVSKIFTHLCQTNPSFRAFVQASLPQDSVKTQAQEAVVTAVSGVHAAGNVSFKIEKGELAVELTQGQNVYTIQASSIADIVMGAWAYPSAPQPTEVEAILLSGDSIIGLANESAKIEKTQEDFLILESASLGKVEILWKNIVKLRYWAHRDKWLTSKKEAQVEAERKKKGDLSDWIYTHTGDKAEGTVLSVSKKGVQQSNTARGRELTFSPQECAAVYFMDMNGARPKIPGSVYSIFRMRDGSVIQGLVRSVRGDILDVENLSGIFFSIPVKGIAEISFRNSRVAYLSDRPLAMRKVKRLNNQNKWEDCEECEMDENTQPEFFEAGETTVTKYFVKRDQNVEKQPISLDGKIYNKGLGVHGRSALAFPLDGQYDRLEGVIGLDDCAKNKKCGTVRFLVYEEGTVGELDKNNKPVKWGVIQGGNKIFDSGPVNSQTPAQPFSVKVDGVKKLILVVEPEDGKTEGDIADWAHLRVIKDK